MLRHAVCIAKTLSTSFSLVSLVCHWYSVYIEESHPVNLVGWLRLSSIELASERERYTSQMSSFRLRHNHHRGPAVGISGHCGQVRIPKGIATIHALIHIHLFPRLSSRRPADLLCSGPDRLASTQFSSET